MVKIRMLVRIVVIRILYVIYTSMYKMDISKTARISFNAKLDKTNPKGIHIGDESYIASGAIIFTHDYSRDIHVETFIGKTLFLLVLMQL